MTVSGEKKISAIKKLAVAAVAAAILAVAAAGILIACMAAQYGGALSRLEDKDYRGAQQKLSGAALYYKDAKDLETYARAGIALTEKRYADAASLFCFLGDFRDSRAMANESGYLGATALLDSGDYDGARRAFAVLAKTQYKDSEAMLKEVDYRYAASLFDKKNYRGAVQAYQKLSGYLDSIGKLEEASGELFKDAKQKYKAEDYAAAGEEFSLIPEYNADVGKYLSLVAAHSVTAYESKCDYKKTKAALEGLVPLGDFEDAKALRASDNFILYSMEGSWTSTLLKETYKIKYDASEMAWYFDTTKIDGVFIKVVKGAFYFREKLHDKWAVAFTIELQSDTKMIWGGSANEDVLYKS